MEVEIPEARETFETNLFAVITMCQTFLPLLIKAQGTIVQIGSVAGVRSLAPPSRSRLTLCIGDPICVRICLQCIQSSTAFFQ